MALVRYVKDSLTPRGPNAFLFLMAECIIVLLIGWIAISYGLMPKKDNSKVLSSFTANNTPTTSPTVAQLSPTPAEDTPTPTPAKLPKNLYTIAVYGDSYVDTMGEKMEYLEQALKEKYPLTNFKLYNYGIGAQNVEDGINRLGTEFNYKERHYPILYQTNPDVIIVGSFAYNPFSPYDRDRHWLGLTQLLREMQKISPNIYLLAEIAPLRGDFGRGPNGVNWDTNTSLTHSQHIMEQLENAMSLSKSLNVPLIDTYHGSLKDGAVIREYVNSGDGIHPSVEGHEYMAHKIADTLDFSTVK